MKEEISNLILCLIFGSMIFAVLYNIFTGEKLIKRPVPYSEKLVNIRTWSPSPDVICHQFTYGDGRRSTDCSGE